MLLLCITGAHCEHITIITTGTIASTMDVDTLKYDLVKVF